MKSPKGKQKLYIKFLKTKRKMKEKDIKNIKSNTSPHYFLIIKTMPNKHGK